MYGAGENIQYLIINYNGKNLTKNICVYTYVIV